MNFRKYAGIILNILVPLFTVYLDLCLGTEAGGVFSSVCDRMDRGSDRKSGGALF